MNEEQKLKKGKKMTLCYSKNNNHKNKTKYIPILFHHLVGSLGDEKDEYFWFSKSCYYF